MAKRGKATAARKARAGRRPMLVKERRTLHFRLSVNEEERELLLAASAKEGHDKPLAWGRTKLVAVARTVLGLPPKKPSR
jgi:hypothetical protein